MTSQLLFCVITPTVLTTSHPIFVWHHTRHMCVIFCTIHDITSSLYDIKPLFLWYHTHSIWHLIHCICVIISTVWWYHTNYFYETSSPISDDIIYIVYEITFTICVTSQSLDLCHHTHSFDIITPFLYMTSHPYLYKIIYTLYGITSTFYDIPPHYLWHHMHCNHDITPTISDIASSVSVPSQPLY